VGEGFGDRHDRSAAVSVQRMPPECLQGRANSGLLLTLISSKSRVSLTLISSLSMKLITYISSQSTKIVTLISNDISANAPGGGSVRPQSAAARGDPTRAMDQGRRLVARKTLWRPPSGRTGHRLRASNPTKTLIKQGIKRTNHNMPPKRTPASASSSNPKPKRARATKIPGVPSTLALALLALFKTPYSSSSLTLFLSAAQAHKDTLHHGVPDYLTSLAESHTAS